MSAVETEFLVISEAVARLEAGRYGGSIKRPEPVPGIEKMGTRYSVGSGARRQKAASAIHEAIISGALGIHVFVPAKGADGGIQPRLVPLDVLKRLPKVRGTLPDRPARHPFNLFSDEPLAPDLFAGLSSSALHLSRAEFVAWYEREKSKRRWPSQRESKQAPIGRPSKITSKLLDLIRGCVAQNAWDADKGIAPLVTLLAPNGAPNRNLVRPAVQQLFEETGDLAYRIVPRKRAKQKPEFSQT
jgi:hypothetical protein